jgi:hypothetical protein
MISQDGWHSQGIYAERIEDPLFSPFVGLQHTHDVGSQLITLLIEANVSQRTSNPLTCMMSNVKNISWLHSSELDDSSGAYNSVNVYVCSAQTQGSGQFLTFIIRVVLNGWSFPLLKSSDRQTSSSRRRYGSSWFISLGKAWHVTVWLQDTQNIVIARYRNKLTVQSVEACTLCLGMTFAGPRIFINSFGTTYHTIIPPPHTHTHAR